MNIQIASIHEQGNAAKEYVLLETAAYCALEFYGLADTTYASDSEIANHLRHFLVLEIQVKAGDRIILRINSITNNMTTIGGYKFHHSF